jgi:transposase InsO family protein
VQGIRQKYSLSVRHARRIVGQPGGTQRGVPEHIRSDNGAEITAKVVRNWLATLGARTLYIKPETRSPWENGYCESFNGKLRDECLNGEIFHSLKEPPSLSSNGAINTIRSGRARPSTIGRPRPRHPQPNCRNWIGITRCNNL